MKACGTTTGYSGGCRCEACRKAKNVAYADWKARKGDEMKAIERRKYKRYYATDKGKEAHRAAARRYFASAKGKAAMRRASEKRRRASR